jgi:hypothetical protein
MEIMCMEATKKMHKTTHKYLILISTLVFLLFTFSSTVFAVNYGTGQYNAGLYSAGQPPVSSSGGFVKPITTDIIKTPDTSSGKTCSNLIITRTLKLKIHRMKGDDVKSLQNCLNIKLPSNNALIADGSFGLKTKLAIILFQKANGLNPDGVAGPKTVKFMK